MPASTAAWTPARISPGARSPPMASTAIGSIDAGRGRWLQRRRRRRRGPCTSRRSGTRCAAAWLAATRAHAARRGARASTRRHGGCGSSTSTSSSWDGHRGLHWMNGCRRLAAVSPDEIGRCTRLAAGELAGAATGRRRVDRAPAASCVELQRPGGPAVVATSVRRSRTDRRCRSTPHVGHRPGQSSRHSGASGAPSRTSSRTIGGEVDLAVLDRERVGSIGRSRRVGLGVALVRRRRPAGRRAAAGSAGTCRPGARSDGAGDDDVVERRVEVDVDGDVGPTRRGSCDVEPRRARRPARRWRVRAGPASSSAALTEQDADGPCGHRSWSKKPLVGSSSSIVVGRCGGGHADRQPLAPGADGLLQLVEQDLEAPQALVEEVLGLVAQPAGVGLGRLHHLTGALLGGPHDLGALHHPLGLRRGRPRAARRPRGGSWRRTPGAP